MKKLKNGNLEYTLFIYTSIIIYGYKYNQDVGLHKYRTSLNRSTFDIMVGSSVKIVPWNARRNLRGSGSCVHHDV